MTEFKKWTGGDCPVDSNQVVEVRFVKDGPVKTRNAGDFRWTWVAEGKGGDIVEYRTV